MPSGRARPDGSLRALTAPTSVAVVGASSRPDKWGHWLASGALAGRDRRPVYLVNRSGGVVLGRSCFPDLQSLPEVPELVALCVPAGEVHQVVRTGLAMGVRAFLGIAGGIPDEDRLAAEVRAHGARLLGANSLGLYDAESSLCLAWGRFSPGALAIVTQSGQLGSELVIQCAQRDVGISRFVSVGNQSDLCAIELLEDLITHERTRAIALYLEDLSDGERLFGLLHTLREAGKPTLLLTVGESSASAQVAHSHTGSLTSSPELVQAAARAAGVLCVRTPRELASIAAGLVGVHTVTGRRVGIVGDSGGQCALAADVASEAGLQVPGLDADTRHRLASLLPTGAATVNPVDLAGAGEADLTAYATVVDTVLADPSVDTVVLTGYFGRYGTDVPSLTDPELQIAHRLVAMAREHGKTVVVHSMSPRRQLAETLTRRGIPVTDDIADAMSTVRGLASLQGATPPTVPARGATTSTIRPGYWAARSLLQEIGVPTPAGRLVQDAEDIHDTTTRLIGPYVLKADWIEHKSEMAAVHLGLVDENAVLSAFDDMRARLGPGEYVVEEQDVRPDCVEILVAGRRDDALGPFVVVGRGGTETEIWHDVVTERAPVSHESAAAMIAQLQCAPLLDGWRGRPPVDMHALADLVVTVSQLVASRKDFGVIELNPVRVAPDGVLAVDAVVVPTDPSSPTPPSTKDPHP